MADQLLVDVGGTLHLSAGLRTRCDKRTLGMTAFERPTSICEKCFGPNADLETVAQRVGTTINSDKPFDIGSLKGKLK
jgi:hypothetical protein